MQIGTIFAIVTRAPPNGCGRLAVPGPSRNPRESITEDVTARPAGLRRPVTGRAIFSKRRQRVRFRLKLARRLLALRQFPRGLRRNA
jgi:hypothetical protein